MVRKYPAGTLSRVFAVRLEYITHGLVVSVVHFISPCISFVFSYATNGNAWHLQRIGWICLLGGVLSRLCPYSLLCYLRWDYTRFLLKLKKFLLCQTQFQSSQNRPVNQVSTALSKANLLLPVGLPGFGSSLCKSSENNGMRCRISAFPFLVEIRISLILIGLIPYYSGSLLLSSIILRGL